MRTISQNDYQYGALLIANGLTRVALHHCIAYSDARMKANILNNQFTSVFTSEDPLQPLPDLGPSPHPAVSDINITQEGIQKLLCHLNPHKATGPDQVSPRLLKETAKQISPALTLYQKNGNLPTSHQTSTRGSVHWACIAHQTIEWYWSKFQREIINTLKKQQPSWMEGGAVGHNFERDTYKDHLCQVWLHLAKLFQRRSFFI
jgi:hypothetical protein